MNDLNEAHLQWIKVWVGKIPINSFIFEEETFNKNLWNQTKKFMT